MSSLDNTGSRGSRVGVRVALVAILVAGFISFFLFGLDDYVTIETLREHRAAIQALVDEYAFLAPATFMVLYAAAIAFSLPGGLVMTIAGGFLFGNVIGTTYIVIAATVGATTIFLIARTALGESLRARAGPWLGRLEAGFQRNAFSYLLVLRLIPLFPFFVVNLVPAFLGVRLVTYFVATFIGIIPATFVFATVGAGLDSLFDSGEEFTTAGILTPEIILALVGLAALAMLPVAYKRFKSGQA
ncbi:MAG: hypothetical protein CL569_12805 [Alphaproteobacteria bacterium]|nr:hypothetical protein [Alphaproteobacteria bacterium]|tara:strand:- start:682 stop:1413 length:732 start_codon:yes stop_codon:yes gene_type:complete